MLLWKRIVEYIWNPYLDLKIGSLGWLVLIALCMSSFAFIGLETAFCMQVFIKLIKGPFQP